VHFINVTYSAFVIKNIGYSGLNITKTVTVLKFVRILQYWHTNSFRQVEDHSYLEQIWRTPVMSDTIWKGNLCASVYQDKCGAQARHQPVIIVCWQSCFYLYIWILFFSLKAIIVKQSVKLYVWLYHSGYLNYGQNFNLQWFDGLQATRFRFIGLHACNWRAWLIWCNKLFGKSQFLQNIIFVR